MKLDFIHDIQRAYRKVVDSMSRPGLITNLKDEAAKVDLEAGCFPSTLVLAAMLLDTEVTFKVVSEKEEETTRWINQLTYAKADAAERADFVFVLYDKAEDELGQILQRVKIGSLIDPHDSATIIVEADAVTDGCDFKLTGPGIEEANYVNVSVNGNWMEVRQQQNAEFPMGVDLIFVDKNHHLLCLPRTTQILSEGRKL